MQLVDNLKAVPSCGVNCSRSKGPQAACAVERRRGPERTSAIKRHSQSGSSIRQITVVAFCGNVVSREYRDIGSYDIGLNTSLGTLDKCL